METQKIALHKFEEGFNCAQSSFYPFAKSVGMSSEDALKLTTAFGAGMIYRGDTCGAVTGAMMAIGLKYGRDNVNDTDAKELTYFLVKELHNKFTDKFGSIQCKQLLGLADVSPESWAKAEGKFKSQCPLYVSEAVKITTELLNKLEK